MCVQLMHAKNLIAYQDMNNLEVSLTFLDNFDSYATKANSSAVKRAGRYELLMSANLPYSMLFLSLAMLGYLWINYQFNNHTKSMLKWSSTVFISYSLVINGFC